MTMIPPKPKESQEEGEEEEVKSRKSSTDSLPKKSHVTVDPSHTIRTSSRDQKLDKHRYHNQSILNPQKTLIQSSTISPLASIVFPRKIRLTSIELLRQSINDDCDQDLLNLIRNFVYVGTIDGQTSLIQHDTQLYLVHTRHLSQELFYQLCIFHFGNMGTIKLTPNPPQIQVFYIDSRFSLRKILFFFFL